MVLTKSAFDKAYPGEGSGSFRTKSGRQTLSRIEAIERLGLENEGESVRVHFPILMPKVNLPRVPLVWTHARSRRNIEENMLEKFSIGESKPWQR